MTSQDFRTEFWSALEETVTLHECEIYKYEPDEESDLNLGKLWTVNYFFFNRKMKKMVLLTAEAVSKLHLQNTHSQAYQQMQRRNLLTDDGMEDYDDHHDLDDDSRPMDSSMVDEDGDDDASMLAAEAAMLNEIGDGSDSAPAAGPYVDVNLLEWEGLPGQSVEQPAVPTSLQFDPFPSDYDTSPSTSSTSTAATVRVRPLPDPASNSPIHALRLASTRTPITSASLQRTPNSIKPSIPSHAQQLMFSGANSGFQTVTPSTIPTITSFTSQQQ